MIRELVTWLGSHLGAGTTGNESDEPSDEKSAEDEDSSGFLASPLDASVMFAHGADIEQVETEGDEELTDAERDALERQQAAREQDRFHEP